MNKCFDNCDNDDFPFNKENGFNTDFKFSKRELIRNNAITGIINALSDKWQIKRAEPKLLSDEEMFEELEIKRFGLKFENYKKRWMEIIRIIRQNGQLIEYQRPEQVELRKAIKKLSEIYSGNKHTDTPMGRAIKALENLKPPNIKGES